MQYFSELRRRRVFRVAGLYAVGAWVTTEVSATVLPLLQVPEKYITGIVIALIVLFPVVMILAWIYDVGPKGITKTPELEEGEAAASRRPGKLFHVSLLFLAVLVFGYALFYLGQTRALQSIPRSSIAVLPFANMSDDASKDYFSDGISEEILNLLAKVEGLSVAARTSSFAYRDSNEDIRAIADKLGVETVLEGSVRWTDDSGRVRITAQLIDAATGYHLWSENFDRDLEDVFQVQSEIAGAIVDILRIQLAPEQAAWTAPTADSEAYDAYLRGRQLLNQRRVAQIRESIDYFHRAVSRDPAFASAFASMAVAYVSLPSFTGEPVEQLHGMAEDAVQRALALSPELAEAHAVRARLAQFEGEWTRAEFGFFAATSMDPNDVTTRVWYSGFLTAAGKLGQGRAQAERALELEPENPLTQAVMAVSAMVEGDNDTCIDTAKKARELGFSTVVNSMEAICLGRLGRLDEAAQVLRAALGPIDESSALASLAAALAGADSLEDAARSAMAQAQEWPQDRWAIWLAAAAGDAEAAFAGLAEVAAGSGYLHLQLLWTPEGAVLRTDDRFLELIRDSGMAQIWRSDLPDLCNTSEDGVFSCT